MADYWKNPGALYNILIILIVISIFIERALALLFESKIYIEYVKKINLKEIIALGAGVIFCFIYDFDVFSLILNQNSVGNYFGYFVTGTLIAGGSKVSIKIFRDIFKIMSNEEKLRIGDRFKKPNDTKSDNAKKKETKAEEP
jgi:hypothetical protein